MENNPVKKAIFYTRLLFYKATSFLQCRNYHLKVIVHELNFLLFTLGLKQLSSSNNHCITLNTHLGDFTVRDITNDIIIASPSYERQDLNELLSQIQTSLSTGHKVLFLDIGACFGKFSVIVGKTFRSYKKNISIVSFEPDTENFKLLKQNIRLNRLKNTKIFRSTLSNNEIHKKFYYFRPMKQVVSFPTNETISLSTTKLDTYLHSMPKERDTDVFIKLDAEGHERKILEGSSKLIKYYKNIIILIEDAGNTRKNNILGFLTKKAHLIKKISLYNSFWRFGKLRQTFITKKEKL